MLLIGCCWPDPSLLHGNDRVVSSCIVRTLYRAVKHAGQTRRTTQVFVYILFGLVHAGLLRGAEMCAASCAGIQSYPYRLGCESASKCTLIGGLWWGHSRVETFVFLLFFLLPTLLKLEIVQNTAPSRPPP